MTFDTHSTTGIHIALFPLLRYAGFLPVASLIRPRLLSYLFFLILTIILATVKSDSFSQNGRVAAVVICLVFQMLALAWYVLSYIPFGRDMVKKCFGC